MSQIDLNSLEKALNSLENILKQDINEFIRDGVIQRFEYTFELTWKTLKRVLKDEGLDEESPKQVLRAAQRAGLIEGIDDWFSLLKYRNLTVHTYNDKTAEEVYENA